VIPAIQHLDQWGIAATMDWKLSDNLALKWISSWREYDSSWGHDVDGTPLPSQQLLQTLNHRQLTEELRLSGQAFDDKLDYTLGLFYFDQKGTLTARVDLNYSGIDFIHGPDQTPAKSKAAFAHTEYHLSDALTFVAGLRFTKDEKEYTYFRSNPDGSIPPACNAGSPFAATQPPNCLLTGLYNRSSDFSSNRTDWRAGLNYRWNESLMTYAQVSTGYKGGGPNPRPFYAHQILTFKPETMTTYEVGAKTDLLDGRVRVNGAVFFNKYKDMILTLSICDVDGPPLTGAGQLPATPCALPSNIGKADVKGLELEANVRLGGGFSLDASFSTLDFQYKETGTNTGITTSMITPYTPEDKYSLGLMWEGDMGDRGSLAARVDWSYQSDMHSAAINQVFTRIPPFGVANARLTWRGAEEKWEASAELNNLTDKLYYTSNTDNSTNAGTTAFGPAMPRNWALTVKRKF
jgi:iron complex outermembrane receptor protein